jgi:type II restriction enzyme
VQHPEGPIIIKRYDPNKGQTSSTAREESISHQMLWRVANAFSPGLPINFDRVLGASYNTRSVLEALIAHTPQFYFCYPGRIETIGTPIVRKGHKHVMWLPENPHSAGVLDEMETDVVISEVPNLDVIYDALIVPENISPGLDIDIQRRHAQIQIALLMIGNQLGFRTWIAQNDRGIIYQDRRIAEHEGVIARLEDERLMSAYAEAIRAALLIDCVWFKNDRLMPAVIEIEHSTGVTRTYKIVCLLFIHDMLLQHLMRTERRSSGNLTKSNSVLWGQNISLTLQLKNYIRFANDVKLVG